MLYLRMDMNVRRCKHIIVSGPRQGTICDRFCRLGGSLCWQHKGREMYNGATVVDRYISQAEILELEKNGIVIVKRKKARAQPG